MAVSKSDKDFLIWVDNKIRSGKPLSGEPSPWDQTTAPFLINEPGDKTWKDIYKRALDNYMNSGGNAKELKTLAPYMTGTKEKQEQQATEFKQQIKETTDPFGAEIDPYNLNVTTDPDNGRTYVSGTYGKDGAAVEHFIYTSNTPGQTKYVGSQLTKQENDISTTISADYDKIRSLVLSDAFKSGDNGQALFDSLYNNGLITKDTYKTKDVSNQDFNKGLQYALRNYATTTIDDYRLKGIKQAGTFLDYLHSNKIAGSGGKAESRTTYESVATKLSDAADAADKFFMTWTGSGATKEQELAYYKMLRDAEKKAVSATTSQYDADGKLISSVRTGELLNETDKLLMLGKIAGNALKGSDIETVLKSGGKAAQDINSIMAYSNRYGVKLNEQDAMGYVADNLKKGTDVSASKSKLIEISKAQYKNLAPLINENVSLADLTTNYKYQYADTLEVAPDSVDVFDPHIQAALHNDNKEGMMSITDFRKTLRQDARWANTKNAKEEASNYAYKILNSLGLMS